MNLSQIIMVHGSILTKKAAWLDGKACLAALAEVETNYGEFNVPKYEKAYDLGGKYENHQLWTKYGAMAACSWSPWQILFPVCVELGFTGRPYDLQDAETAIYWVTDYIDKRILQRGATTPSQIADGWNSGSFTDNIIPTDYINKFLTSYATVVERRQLIEIQGVSNG
jgi:hypothetical protein